jgi:hypothetical protein
METTRALMHGIVDYAGLFPPASLDMPKTVANYARYRSGEDRWALGRLVVPLKRCLLSVGADPGAMTAVRLSRLPGQFRAEKGMWQRLLYGLRWHRLTCLRLPLRGQVLFLVLFDFLLRVVVAVKLECLSTLAREPAIIIITLHFLIDIFNSL